MEAKMNNASLSESDPYVSNQDVEYVLSDLATMEKVSLPELPDVFQLNPDARWRIESFGATVFIKHRFTGYLNSAASRLLDGLVPNRKYYLIDFINRFDGNEEEFLKRLHSKKIIVFN